jgi:hypothetical protein
LQAKQQKQGFRKAKINEDLDNAEREAAEKL